MSDAADQPVPKVLHIVTGSAQMAAEVEADLRALGLRIERCGDVYRGLARLQPNGADLAAAVIVGVDRLNSDQFEFFQHAAHLQPSMPLLVYGLGRHVFKLERALQQGATARLSEEALQELGQPPNAEGDLSLPSSRATSEAQAPIVAEELVGGVLAETPAAGKTKPAPRTEDLGVMAEAQTMGEPEEADEFEEEGEFEIQDEQAHAEEFLEPTSRDEAPAARPEAELDESQPEPSAREPDVEAEPAPASRPRVPWIRDTDRPVRRPPPAPTTPARPQPEPADEPEARRDARPEPVPAAPPHEVPAESLESKQKSDDDKYAPLLSAEEWRALMGDDDDISAIVPPDPEQEESGS